MSRSRRGPNLWQRLGAWWQGYHWFVIVAISAVTLALGVFGIPGYCEGVRDDAWVSNQAPQPPCHVTLTAWDIIYLSFQLFIWQSGNLFLGEHAGLSLQIARLLGPAVLGYAAIRALLVVFSDQFQVLRARVSRDHVVVCGLGRRGLLLAQTFRAAGWRVVALERNALNPSIAAARKFAPVLVGDALDARSLARAGVDRATHLIAVCGSDGVNAEVAAQAGSLLASGQGRILTAHVHIADPELWEHIRAQEITAGGNGRLRLHFFNVFDAAARALAGAAFHGRPNHGWNREPHALIVGLEPLAERLIVHAARSWRIVRTHPADQLHITVVDKSATAKVQALLLRYPRLGEVSKVLTLDLDVRSPEFERSAFLTDAKPPITIGYVNLGDESVSLSTGLALYYRARARLMPVVICTTHEKGLGVVLEGVEKPNAGDRLTLFGILERACAPEVLLGGTNEILARAIHEEYRRDQTRAGQTADTNALMMRWEELPNHFKESNRQQADNIGRKLEAIGCAIAPLTDWDALPAPFELEEIERMARMEHTRWVAERKAHGWRYDPGPRDIERKTSPYLVDWESLAERVKDFDRNTVRELPALLARAGLAVYRCQVEKQVSEAQPALEEPAPRANEQVT